jgi:hypothetical protein
VPSTRPPAKNYVAATGHARNPVDKQTPKPRMLYAFSSFLRAGNAKKKRLSSPRSTHKQPRSLRYRLSMQSARTNSAAVRNRGDDILVILIIKSAGYGCTKILSDLIRASRLMAMIASAETTQLMIARFQLVPGCPHLITSMAKSMRARKQLRRKQQQTIPPTRRARARQALHTRRLLGQPPLM